VGAMAIGPHALQIVYGPDFDAGRAALGLLGVGVGLYLAASTVSQALLAQDRGPAAALAWAVAAVLFVGTFFLLPGSELMRIAVAFALSMAVGAAMVAGFLLRRDPGTARRPGLTPQPLPER
jgi:O-antigen/teichoic acid export membrane protein